MNATGLATMSVGGVDGATPSRSAAGQWREKLRIEACVRFSDVVVGYGRRIAAEEFLMKAGDLERGADISCEIDPCRQREIDVRCLHRPIRRP